MCGPHHCLGRDVFASGREILRRLLQLRQNASIIGQGCSGHSPNSANRKHQITRHPWRTSSPLWSDLMDLRFSVHTGSQGTSVSAAVGQGQGASRRVHTRERGLADNLKAPPLQRHSWARNVPYALTVSCNPLKSQHMRAPSERTTIFYSAPFFCGT